MKKVLALIVLCFIAFNSHAQLKYQNGYLVYNAMERYNGYMTNWEGWAHCWKFGNRMIKFDLGPADSRVSSNSDKLVLYDTENGGFIDLYARNVYTNSDAASKTNIQSLGSATATLTQLRPVSFEWADKAHYFKTSRRSTQRNGIHCPGDRAGTSRHRGRGLRGPPCRKLQRIDSAAYEVYSGA